MLRRPTECANFLPRSEQIYSNTNVQGLVSQHGDRLEIRTLFRSGCHSRSLLPWSHTDACWVDRPEPVEVPLPSTDQKFLAGFTDVSGFFNTSPTEIAGVCLHLVVRGLRVLLSGERLPSCLSICILSQRRSKCNRNDNTHRAGHSQKVLPSSPPCDRPSPPGRSVINGSRRDERTTDILQSHPRPLVSAAKPITGIQVVRPPQVPQLAYSGCLQSRIMLARKRKILSILVIFCYLLSERQQLSDQSQYQTRFGACHNTISLQLWLVQRLNDLWSNDLRRGMTGLLKHLCDLLVRSFHSLLRGRVGLQKDQRRALLQLAKQLQGDRIARLQASGELIDQASLTLDQAVLIAAEPFEFGDLRTIGFQSSQVGEIRSTCFWKPSRHRSNQSWFPMQLCGDRRSWD